MTAVRTTICAPAEVLAALGKAGTATDNDRGLVNMLLPMVDDAVKDYLGWSVLQATYTHLLPDMDMFDATTYNSAWDFGEPFDAVNGRISYAYPGIPQLLQVPEIPLRSVSSFFADFSAAGGQNAADFSAATALRLGTDWYIDFDAPDPGQTIPYQSGVCWSGHVRRWLGGVWPARQRSALITYIAGLSPDELDGHVTIGFRRVGGIKYAAVLTAVQAFLQFKSLAVNGLGAQGPIISERLGDAQFQYAEQSQMQNLGMQVNLPDAAKKLLNPHARVKR